MDPNIDINDLPLMKDNPLTRLSEMLNDFVGGLLDFCQNYLFCLIAMGLWIKIFLCVFSGRRVSVLMIMLAVACSCIAIAAGAIFW